MKKVFALIVLCTAVFANAQSVPSIGKAAPREHRGFYSNFSFGFAYNWYKNSVEDIDKDGWWKEHDIDYFEYYGFTYPLTEFKFGVALGNLAAFHLVFNVGFFAGTMDYSYYKRSGHYCIEGEVDCVDGDYTEKDTRLEPSASDAYSFRTYIGFGTTIYPIQDKNSPLNGLFIGGSFGYTLFITLINSCEEDASGNGGIGFQLEIGKDWWINDNMSIGVGFGFAHNGLTFETVDSHRSDNVLSLSFRITRG